MCIEGRTCEGMRNTGCVSTEQGPECCSHELGCQETPEAGGSKEGCSP